MADSRSVVLHALAPFAVATGIFLASSAAKAAPSKEQCVASHGTGQDLRARGQLAQARQEFLSCAQASCPTLVQADCARFGEELGRMVPTVTFAARDSGGADITDTQVYVDDRLVAQRLEGKTYELDPGKHVVRWVHQGKETTETVVLNQGEQGREILATFGGAGAAKPGDSGAAPSQTVPAAPESHKSLLPIALVGVGGAATVTGVILLAVGLGKVPSSCSLSSNTCTAAPGDAVFGTAHNGVVLADVGLAVGVAGLAAVAGGIIWYAAEPTQEKAPPATGKLLGPITPAPWFDGKSGGLGLHASF